MPVIMYVVMHHADECIVMAPCNQSKIINLLSIIALYVQSTLVAGFPATNNICFSPRRRDRRQCRLCLTQKHDKECFPADTSRRQWITETSIITFLLINAPASGASDDTGVRLVEVTDPATYSALVYTPPEQNDNTFPPLLVAIHGAGKNERDVWNLADIQGEHAGLIPSLIASGTAPQVLLDNFAVVAPYSQGKRSFYEEPRQKLLQFIDWVCSDAGQQAGCPKVDTNRIFLFGFSDGATEAVELLTTGQFRGGIVAAYGFTGTLPSRATDRLKDVPIWVFHSRDDVIFPVACSDRLVATLRENNSNDKDTVRYSRFDKDQEGFTGAVRGHSTGITASRSPQVYEWLLSL